MVFFPQDRNLYRKTETGWLRNPPTNDRQYLPIYSHRGTVTVAPQAMEVAMVFCDSWICTGTGPITPNAIQCPPNFVTFIQQSTTAELCLLQIVNIRDIDQLAEWIKQGKAVIVSNGSYKNAIGTAVVIIEGLNGSGRLSFQASTPGSGSEMNAFRSELTGIMSGVLMTVEDSRIL